MQYFYPPNERILLIFNVREEALFHDGTPVLAEDVKYTVDRMLALKIEVWAYLTPVSGAEVLDERRRAIDLSVPFAGLLGAMTRLYIANADLIRANEFQGDFRQRWLQNHEAGSGPLSVGLVSARAAVYGGALPRLPPGLGIAPRGARRLSRQRAPDPERLRGPALGRTDPGDRGDHGWSTQESGLHMRKRARG